MYPVKLLFLLFTVVQAFTGDLTFYSEEDSNGNFIPRGVLGSCQLPNGFNNIPITVAMNQAQYENGNACGRCILIYPTTDGLGTKPLKNVILATVNNVCPECTYGSIDLNLSLKDHDGRWKVNWEFTDCQRKLRGLTEKIN